MWFEVFPSRSHREFDFFSPSEQTLLVSQSTNAALEFKAISFIVIIVDALLMWICTLLLEASETTLVVLNWKNNFSSLFLLFSFSLHFLTAPLCYWRGKWSKWERSKYESAEKRRGWGGGRVKLCFRVNSISKCNFFKILFSLSCLVSRERSFSVPLSASRPVRSLFCYHFAGNGCRNRLSFVVCIRSVDGSFQAN